MKILFLMTDEAREPRRHGITRANMLTSGNFVDVGAILEKSSTNIIEFFAPSGEFILGTNNSDPIDIDGTPTQGLLTTGVREVNLLVSSIQTLIVMIQTTMVSSLKRSHRIKIKEQRSYIGRMLLPTILSLDNLRCIVNIGLLQSTSSTPKMTAVQSPKTTCMKSPLMVFPASLHNTQSIGLLTMQVSTPGQIDTTKYNNVYTTQERNGQILKVTSGTTVKINAQSDKFFIGVSDITSGIDTEVVGTSIVGTHVEEKSMFLSQKMTTLVPISGR